MNRSHANAALRSLAGPGRRARIGSLRLLRFADGGKPRGTVNRVNFRSVQIQHAAFGAAL